jgi:hypothetical protein
MTRLALLLLLVVAALCPAESEASMSTAKIGNLEVNDLRGTLPATGEYRSRELSQIKRIIIHHTAGAERDYTAHEIAQIQLTLWANVDKTIKFPALAYHFLVHWDGSIDYTQDVARLTWHAGPANADSIAICLAGDWSRRVPPDAMLNGVRDLVANLQMAMGVWYPVEGHSDVMQTSCPGATWAQWRERVTVRPPQPTPEPEPVPVVQLKLNHLKATLALALADVRAIEELL